MILKFLPRSAWFRAALALALFAPLAAVPQLTAQETRTAARSENADAILDRLRMSQTLQNRALKGSLRVGSGSKKTPFKLELQGPVSTYTFLDSGESLRLSLGERGSTIEEISPDGKVTKVGKRQFSDRIVGTPITYEDISLRFLYWPHAEVEGEETINTRACHKLWVASPKGTSQYAGVRVWVDKGSGALMRADCFAPGGELAKRFSVRSGQEIGGQWALKQMRIESFNPPGSGKATQAYLEIDGLWDGPAGNAQAD